MNKLTAYEKERLKRINIMMDQLYDKLDEIYEEIADEQYIGAHRSIDRLISNLNDIKDSIAS